MFFEDDLDQGTEAEQPNSQGPSLHVTEASQESRGSLETPSHPREAIKTAVKRVVPAAHLSSSPQSASAADSRWSHDMGEGVSNQVGQLRDWVQELAQLTETERRCPDLLPYPEDFIGYVTTSLQQRQVEISNLAAKEKELAVQGETRSFLPFNHSDIMQLETQRARFFLTEFLRCRIQKIQVLCMTLYYEGLVEQEEQSGETRLPDETDGPSQPVPKRKMQQVHFPQRAHLSPNEAVVADRLAKALEQAVSKAGLHLVPDLLQRLIPSPPYGEGLEILPQSNPDMYVFAQAVLDLGIVSFGDGADQEIREGDLFLVPYRTFRPYVMNGSVRLV